MPGCTMTGFPSLSSYAEARKHFDSVTPWRSQYNPHDAERPIGQRAVKLSHCGTRFNKAMRELRDGSIAFRLYDTDCVVWHPDNKLTIEGWDTMSTSAFIDRLVPDGVTHMTGRKDHFEPCLHLRGSRRPDYDSGRSWDAPKAYWRSGQIIQCVSAVMLDYNADADMWLPVEPDALEPFQVPVLDRKALYRASRKYHLPTLTATIDALAAMSATADQRYDSYGWIGQAVNHLAKGQIMSAIELLPRNRGGSVDTSAIRVLRNSIYSDEGVVTRVDKRSLTPAEYRRYIAQSKIYF